MKKYISGLLAAFSLALLLPACSLFQTATTAATTPVGASDLATAKNTVYTIKSGYGVALVAVTAYGALPDCGQPASPPLCRSYTVMQSIEKARASVSAAIASAENEVMSISPNTTVLSAAVSSAKSAWATFQTIMSTYNVTGKAS